MRRQGVQVRDMSSSPGCDGCVRITVGTREEMTQVAETTRQMRADLKNLNGVEYKNHRVYRKAIPATGV